MYRFQIQGGSGIYDIEIKKTGENLVATCSCAAGQNNMVCRHRLSIFAGNGEDVISDNKADVHKIPAFISDTIEGGLIHEITTLEQQLENIKKDLSNKKKLLGKLLSI